MQLNLNNEIKVFNMMCREVKDSHTGANIKNWMKEAQDLYEIDDEQIHGVSIDSAANMTLGVSLFIDQLECVTEIEEDSDILSAVNFDNIVIPIIENEIEEDTSESNEKALRVHCVVHRLQLGVNDFTSKNKDVAKLISATRKISAKLRNPLIRIQLEHENQNMALIDQVTRWSSSYKMIERLLSLKEFCQSKEKMIPGVYLASDKWNQLHQLHEVLKPVAVLTAQLQSEKLDVTQFVFFWKSAMHKLEKGSNSMSRKLREEIRKREKLIFANKIIISAIFLDKRFYFMLTSEEKAIARSFIRSVSSKQNFLSGTAEQVENYENDQDDAEDSFEKSMNELSKSSCQAGKKRKDKMEQELVEYENLERLKPSESIMEFWKNRKTLQLFLSRAAIDIISAPVHEISVERLFSNLNFILNKHRSVLSSSLLEDILFLRMNRKFSNDF